MLSKLKNIASVIQESVAPIFRTNLDTFINAWKKIEEEYGNIMQQKEVDLDDPKILRESTMVEYLNQLVEALVREEKEDWDRSGEGKTGPCFEYLLNQGVLDKLCAYGLPDRPPGMRTLVTRTLDAILAHTEHPILPSMSIHQAIRQFLDVCFKHGDLRPERATVKSAYVSLLWQICFKVREETSLAGIFFDHSPQNPNQHPEFLLFTALCTLINDRDDDSRKALEGLLCLLQVPNEHISRFVIKYSSFCQELLAGLVQSFLRLPKVYDQTISESLPSTDPKAAPLLSDFFDRVAYLDQVAESTYSDVGVHLANLFLEKFLEPIIKPLLTHVQEKQARWTTVYLRNTIQLLRSTPMIRVVVTFLLGSAPLMETKEEEKDHPLRTTLIKRCNSLNEELCVATLGLFDTLIGFRDQEVIMNLVLRNFLPCTFVPSTYRPVFKEMWVNTLVPPVLAKSTSSLSSLLTFFPGIRAVHKEKAFEEARLDAQAENLLWTQAWERWPLGQKAQLEAQFNARADAKKVNQRYAELRSPTRIKGLVSDFVDTTSQVDTNSDSDASSGRKDSTSSAPGSPEKPKIRNQLLDPASDGGGSSSSSSSNSLDVLASFFVSPSSASASSSSITPSIRSLSSSSLPSSPTTPSTVTPLPGTPGGSELFYEGLFLTVLFQKLRRIFTNSFTCNLRLTSILAQLALCPHPIMHCYFLQPPPTPFSSSSTSHSILASPLSHSNSSPISSPSTPDRLHYEFLPNVKFLLRTLGEIWVSGQKKCKLIKNYDQRIKDERQRISAGDLGQGELDVQKYLRGMIVLEEFIIELLAIYQVKNYYYKILSKAADGERTAAARAYLRIQKARAQTQQLRSASNSKPTSPSLSSISQTSIGTPPLALPPRTSGSISDAPNYRNRTSHSRAAALLKGKQGNNHQSLGRQISKAAVLAQKQEQRLRSASLSDNELSGTDCTVLSSDDEAWNNGRYAEPDGFTEDEYSESGRSPSRPGSRSGSRPSSRVSSRPSSRVSSRPGSRASLTRPAVVEKERVMASPLRGLRTELS